MNHHLINIIIMLWQDVRDGKQGAFDKQEAAV